MKHRIISTSFHTDEKIEVLSKDARWLFMYFLSCPYIGMTGAFQVSDRRLVFETAMTDSELITAKEELQKAGLVDFKGSFIIVKNAEKHNRYRVNEKTSKAYSTELKGLPEDIQRLITEEKPLSDTPSAKNDASSVPLEIEEEIENIYTGAREIVTEKQLRSHPAIRYFSEKHQIDVKVVQRNIELCVNHILTNNRRCHNWGAEFENWILRGIERKSIKRTAKNILPELFHLPDTKPEETPVIQSILNTMAGKVGVNRV